MLNEEFGPLTKLPGMLNFRDILVTSNADDVMKVFRVDGKFVTRHGQEALCYYRENFRQDIFGEFGSVVTK